VPLIERVILTAHTAGISDFTVVTGYRGEKVRLFLDRFAERRDLQITHIINDEWKKESGVTVFKAKPHINENFVLLMCDHIFDASTLVKIQRERILPGELILATPTGSTWTVR
jgi:choline kinase